MRIVLFLNLCTLPVFRLFLESGRGSRKFGAGVTLGFVGKHACTVAVVVVVVVVEEVVVVVVVVVVVTVVVVVVVVAVVVVLIEC